MSDEQTRTLKGYTYNVGGKWTGIMYPCAIGAHSVCRNWTPYLCPRQPTHHCWCECHKDRTRNDE